MIKRVFILIFAILSILLVPAVIARTDYNETGLSSGTYDLTDQRGLFNLNIDANAVDLNIVDIGLSDNTGTILVANLDNAGLKEIIVLDDGDIRLFTKTNIINVIDSVSVGTSATEFSNMITFDIDGDGRREVLVADIQTGLISIADYNGTDFVIQAIINLTGLTDYTVSTTNPSDVMIKCKGVNSCLVAYTETVAFQGGDTQDIFAAFFNSTDVGSAVFIASAGAGTQSFCFPKIKQIQVADYDEGDGTEEYIYSAMLYKSAGDEDVHIFYVDILAGNIPTLELTNIITDTDSIGSGTSSCQASDSRVGNFFTSPLVAESGDGGKPETWLGSMKDPNEFRLYKFDFGDPTAETFPKLAFDSDGIIISNVFIANGALDGTGRDFCVMGQTPLGTGEFGEDDQITVLCGSEINSVGIFDNVQFQFEDFSETFEFNISLELDNWFIAVHSVDMAQTDSPDSNEILTSYGVFDLDTDSCSVITNNCNLNLIFDTPESDGIAIAVDYEDVGLVDIIHATETQLNYIDDLFSNSQVEPFCGETGSVTGTCSEYVINPCIDSVWKINTSVAITITPKDFDGDSVSARAILYSGDSNEQDSGFSANVTSGSEIALSFGSGFIGNKTIATGVISLQIRDTGNENIRTLTKSFSVANSGVEFGDCKTEAIIGVDAVEDEEIILVATITDDATDNAVTNAIQTLSGLLGLAGTTIWLIVMIALSIGIWGGIMSANKQGFQISGSSALGMIAILNVLMIVLGARLGILSTALVVIITVLGVIIIAVFLGKFLTGATGIGGNGGA